KAPLSVQLQPSRYAPLQVIARPPRRAFDEADMAAAAVQFERRGGRELLWVGDAVPEHEGGVFGLDQQGRHADVGQEVATRGTTVVVLRIGIAVQRCGEAAIEIPEGA